MARNGEAEATVAERSTATSPPQDPASTEQASDGQRAEGKTEGTAQERPQPTPEPVELHSGHRLAGRYRLEECITRLDGFSSWRAVDEKLRRAVGVHVLPASHERAATVLSAARATALLGDPRFVQVLDAVEEKGLVHVIHEWLPDATPLHTVLHAGPLDPHEAQALAGQVAQAMAAAHRENLVHLRLNPATVLRTGPCQFRIRGLAVDAALRGIEVEDPQRADTEAIGALLYAALTQRWPYPEGVYGLSGVAGLSKGSREPLLTPEQVRAGVHRGLSELAMRALVNDGATAVSEKPALTTPEELSAALAQLPRIRPPEPTPSALPQFHQPTTYQRGTLVAGGPPTAPGRPGVAGAAGSAPPALGGRWGTALKVAVSALLIAALGLGSWQLADALLKGDTPADATPAPGPDEGDDVEEPPPGPLEVSSVTELDPEGSGQNPESAPLVIDGDPESYWQTKNYYGPSFGNLKRGLGLILDLGEAQEVRSLTVEAVGDTAVEFRAAPADATTPPSGADDFVTLDSATGSSLTLQGDEPVTTRFVLVWLTDLPLGNDGNYRGRITDISVNQ
ncbi:serine/threonine protein kinase [Streptomyces sp. 3MP-14]|uniref:Serine/threonine protein kinase n=1 Tax=Streptomyces mimosae TaxID=2586635 RepID=A0A5N6A5Y3_9ACTN|nr:MULTISPECIES: protein kinase family protein [Streptomyces]KAB8163336.1 serine/threonine protein kinase [Streptomyces mimosae]KAB8174613.1 serine/threonine protein kinase [Streptomyces sp. 3MP-14]